jgi:hypothetical protein
MTTPIYHFEVTGEDGQHLGAYNAFERDGVWWETGPRGDYLLDHSNRHDLGPPEKRKITKTDITHAFNSKKVVGARSKKYPALQEFADAFVKCWQGDPEPMNAYVAACTAVKAAHPKPVADSVPAATPVATAPAVATKTRKPRAAKAKR